MQVNHLKGCVTHSLDQTNHSPKRHKYPVPLFLCKWGKEYFEWHLTSVQIPPTVTKVGACVMFPQIRKKFNETLTLAQKITEDQHSKKSLVQWTRLDFLHVSIHPWCQVIYGVIQWYLPENPKINASPFSRSWPIVGLNQLQVGAPLCSSHWNSVFNTWLYSYIVAICVYKKTWCGPRWPHSWPWTYIYIGPSSPLLFVLLLNCGPEALDLLMLCKIDEDLMNCAQSACQYSLTCWEGDPPSPHLQRAQYRQVHLARQGRGKRCGNRVCKVFISLCLSFFTFFWLTSAHN